MKCSMTEDLFMKHLGIKDFKGMTGYYGRMNDAAEGIRM